MRYLQEVLGCLYFDGHKASILPTLLFQKQIGFSKYVFTNLTLLPAYELCWLMLLNFPTVFNLTFKTIESQNNGVGMNPHKLIHEHAFLVVFTHGFSLQ